jgi:hypothetical protein
MVDGDHRRAGVERAASLRREGVPVRAVALGQRAEPVVAERVGAGVARERRLVRHQEPGQHGAVGLDLRGRRLHLHARLAGAHAGGRQHALAHVDHAQRRYPPARGADRDRARGSRSPRRERPPRVWCRARPRRRARRSGARCGPLRRSGRRQASSSSASHALAFG